MTRYEIIALNRELLKRLYDYGINTADFRFAEIYEDYQTMVIAGDKVRYVASMLSRRYNISERSIYRIVAAMQEEC